jgi:hypothetical protein
MMCCDGIENEVNVVGQKVLLFDIQGVPPRFSLLRTLGICFMGQDRMIEGYNLLMISQALDKDRSKETQMTTHLQ